MIVLILIDGVKTEMAPELKVFKWLAARGSFTLQCRPSYPCLTEPCIAAMLYGIDPVYLGTYWMSSKPWGKYDSYLPGNKDVFTAIRQVKPRSRCAVVGTWPRMGGIVDMKYAEDHTRRSRVLDEGVIDEALQIIEEGKVDLLLIYLEDPDHQGHEVGLGKKYKDALDRAQLDVARVIKALDPARDTLIVTSDHSRDTKEHAWYTSTVMQVILFMWGRGIRARHPIREFVGSIDIVPTIMRLMGLTPPPVWRGRVVESALT